jgi:hypothetical protein
MYQQNINTTGMDSLISIKSGLQYSEILWDAGNCIIAEQLATKLLTISRHVHGPEHKVTLRAEELIGNDRGSSNGLLVFFLMVQRNSRLCDRT